MSDITSIDQDLNPSAFTSTDENKSVDVNITKAERLYLEHGRYKFARPISPILVSGLARFSEFLLVFILGLIVFSLYVGIEDDSSLTLYVVAAVTAASVTSVVFHALELYELNTILSLGRQIPRIFLGWGLVFLLLLSAAFFFKIGADYSRVWLATWFLTGLIGLLIFRSSFSAKVSGWTQKGRLDRRAIIVGGGPEAEILIEALEANDNGNIEICGIFDDRSDKRVSTNVAGYPKLGNITELVEFTRKTRIDLLIVSLPMAAEQRLLQILKKLWVLPVDIRLSAQTNALRFRPRTYSYIGNVPFIDLHDRPIADWDQVLKWLTDKLIAIGLIIGTAPLMALVALAIKLDSPGPVLFRQRRYGFNNDLIEVFKFRSMYVDQADQKASKLVTKDDPRVTRVGRFIRKTSLDELPQFFNVLLGELSLVGPRPHALEAKAQDKLYNDVVDGYFARHRVKPGVTGWAQINGWRGETDTTEKIQRRVDHDLYYIENWSVFFDLYILLMTPIALANTKNAY